MGLTREDVERLLQLVETSHFDELDLETGDTGLVLRRRGDRLRRGADAPAPAVRAA